MALVLSNLRETLFKLGPLILLVFICISEFHTQFYYWGIFTFNFQFIIIYYWILRDPDILGYGFVFICGFRNSLFTDWFTFVVAIIIGNFIYFFLLNKFANADIKYTTFFYNSLFTFILYPFFWGLFEIYKKITFSRRND